ncbi:hypothetical protein [Streptomyces sp. CC224B]|uniref:hypothetical protein n=1 Tax=Streptomyces sp. CC224B TaxID=3044571 RepID=UPI0024A980A8|nr:hypothetical protein [Streptomyces sp. CC224B]
MSPAPEFSNERWKYICAAAGVNVETVTDAFGRTDIRIDRPGMERLRDFAQSLGQTDVADFFARCLNAGGQR